MATIREKRPGVWEVRVFLGRDARGRPRQVSRAVRGTKRDAQKAAAALTVRPPPVSERRTVADALDAWLEVNRPTWAATTQRDQAGRVAAVKQDSIARMRVERVTVSDVELWHAHLRSEGIGEAAIRNRHLVLRAAFAQALRWEWIATNPAASARLTAPKVKPRGGLSAEDVRSVLTAARANDRSAELALRLAAVTGARRAELAALRWDDLRDGRLLFDGAIEVVRSKDTPPALQDAAAKTANQRLVSLDTETVVLIEQLREERSPFGPWMFSIGAAPPNPDRIGYWWAQARQRAGIDPSWRLHDLRHWSATVGISHGHDVRTVAGRLGHANPAMTLKVYAHAVAAADQGVAGTIGQVLAGEN